MEHQETGHAGSQYLHTRDEVVERTEVWLARFAPLLDDAAHADQLDVAEVRARLETLAELDREGGEIERALREQAGPDERTLLDTFQTARAEAGAIEGDFRRRLGSLAPGDPASRVNLDRLRTRLAEVQARREVEEWTGPTADEPGAELMIHTSPPQWAGAGFLGLFGLGWTSFTTFHAVMMIGGMWQAFGWPALFMLLFYSIFFAVGFGMLAGAAAAAADEWLVLNGRDVTIQRRIGPVRWLRRHRLGEAATARLVDRNLRQEGSTATEVALMDRDGKEVRFAANAPTYRQEELVKQLKTYLRSAA